MHEQSAQALVTGSAGESDPELQAVSIAPKSSTLVRAAGAVLLGVVVLAAGGLSLARPSAFGARGAALEGLANEQIADEIGPLRTAYYSLIKGKGFADVQRINGEVQGAIGPMLQDSLSKVAPTGTAPTRDAFQLAYLQYITGKTFDDIEEFNNHLRAPSAPEDAPEKKSLAAGLVLHPEFGDVLQDGLLKNAPAGTPQTQEAFKAAYLKWTTGKKFFDVVNANNRLHMPLTPQDPPDMKKLAIGIKLHPEFEQILQEGLARAAPTDTPGSMEAFKEAYQKHTSGMDFFEVQNFINELRAPPTIPSKTAQINLLRIALQLHGEFQPALREPLRKAAPTDTPDTTEIFQAAYQKYVDGKSFFDVHDVNVKLRAPTKPPVEEMNSLYIALKLHGEFWPVLDEGLKKAAPADAPQSPTAFAAAYATSTKGKKFFEICDFNNKIRALQPAEEATSELKNLRIGYTLMNWHVSPVMHGTLMKSAPPNAPRTMDAFKEAYNKLIDGKAHAAIEETNKQIMRHAPGTPADMKALQIGFVLIPYADTVLKAALEKAKEL